MTRLALFLALVVPALGARPAAAQLGSLGGGTTPPRTVVTWSARAVPERGQARTYRVELTGAIESGWHVYGMRSRAGRPLAVDVSGLPDGFRLLGQPVEAGLTLTGHDDALDIDYPYFAERAGVALRVAAGRGVRPGRHVVRGTVRYAACDDRICLPPRTVPFEATVTVRRGR